MFATLVEGLIAAPRMRSTLVLASRVAVSLFVACLCACTSVGVRTQNEYAHDYGPSAQLRVCFLRAGGVSPQRVDQLVAAVNEEFKTFGIEIVVPWVRSWERPGFGHDSLLDDVVARELEPPCDRLVALVDRNAGDALWGLLMPEVLGAVDDSTHTRGFIVANRASVNQLFMPPSKVTVHEFYHLLGCPHARTLTNCYAQIERIKRQINTRHPEFFPGIDGNGTLLVTRDEANDVLRQTLALK
ncbi:hypothetical protein J2X04_002095 [Lysobacter niabensis]|uniref:Uncharacterized protein n=1 Tax=Agrilutibacter niabensis TaxID=380628 RepID=A0ABU1VQE9_9GAMM|nr:hypothetical protein [Lysobacter niabensis]MDR7099714.1 hypothetical protein [Lysobacter niabensis]